MTTALFVSPPTGFEFKYGKGSFERHLREARRLGMQARIVHAPGLKFDLDTEEDLSTFYALNGALAESAYFESVNFLKPDCKVGAPS